MINEIDKKSDKLDTKHAKKPYAKPIIESEQVLEQAALVCSGVFPNPLLNLKDNQFSCGFNDSWLNLPNIAI